MRDSTVDKKETKDIKRLSKIKKQGTCYLKTILSEKQKQNILREDLRQILVASLAYKPSLLLHEKKMTVQELQQQFHTYFESRKVKFSKLMMESYSIIPQQNPTDEDLIDFIAIKSDVEKTIYIGISGSRFFGVFSGLFSRDMRNNLSIHFRGRAYSKRQAQTQNFVKKYLEAYPYYMVIVCGHSLGGNLSQYTVMNLQNNYKNIKCTSINSWHGWCKQINKQILDHGKIKRLRTKKEWPFNHGIANFTKLIWKLFHKGQQNKDVVESERQLTQGRRESKASIALQSGVA